MNKIQLINMGFFKKLFRRKKGGTVFGNILRGVTNKVSGGVLGNGADLRRFEEKQAAKEQAAVSKLQQKGSVKDTIKEVLAEQIPKSKEGKELIDEAKKQYLKDNWWKILLGIVGFGGAVAYGTKKMSNNNKRKPSPRY